MKKLYISYPTTLSLILVQFLIFLLISLSNQCFQSFLYYGSAYHQRILDGELWRLITAIFLHADLPHLFYNLFTLLLIGTFLETVLSAKYILLIFLSSGIAANFILLFVVPNDLFLHYGSSSAIAGMFGALIILILSKRIALPFYTVYILLLGFGFHIATSLLNFQINTIGHLLGFIFGTLLTLALTLKNIYPFHFI